MSSEADEKAINVKSSGLGSLLEWEARKGNMAFEITVISVGAALILLLLMALTFTPGQRGKSEKDDMNQNNSGIYRRVLYFCLGKPPSLDSFVLHLCSQT